MKKRVWLLGILLSLFFLASCSLPGGLAESTHQVGPISMPENAIAIQLDHVIDGDTLSVKINGKTKTVRLLLIDTPESVKSNTPVQPFAKEASKYMKELTAGKALKLEYGRGVRTDKYGRLLAYVYADGKNVNQIMLERGYARIAYVYEPNTRYIGALKEAENDAKEKQRKIWSIPDYVTDQGFKNEME